ncbi:MAG: cytochrome c-type biogenesis protein CcmH [Acidimicrobiia bacterium]
MSDRMKNVAFAVVALVAISVIGVGLGQTDTSPPTDAERVDALAARIKCPFCNGESLYDSQASIAVEYRTLIRERVEAGATDDEIIAEFVANFGDSYILDTSTTGWSFGLWMVPMLGFIVGGAVLVWLSMSSRSRSRVTL